MDSDSPAILVEVDFEPIPMPPTGPLALDCLATWLWWHNPSPIGRRSPTRRELMP